MFTIHDLLLIEYKPALAFQSEHSDAWIQLIEKWDPHSINTANGHGVTNSSSAARARMQPVIRHVGNGTHGPLKDLQLPYTRLCGGPCPNASALSPMGDARDEISSDSKQASPGAGALEQRSEALDPNLPPCFQNARVYENEPFTSEVPSGRYPASVPSNDPALNNLRIPGMGTKLNNCAKYATTRFVHCSLDPEHERYEIRGSSCGDPQCPVCYRTWITRAADRISCRVQGYQRFARKPPRHVVLSLSENDDNFEDLMRLPPTVLIDKLRKIFRKKAIDVGITGGAMIIHLWRTTDRVPRDSDRKKWDWVRNDGNENFNSNIEFSPHAHIAAYGWLKYILDDGAFLYKNVGSLPTRDAIESWASYALSHAPLISGSTTYTYLGCCSYRKLKASWIGRISVQLKCPVCGAPMIYEGTHEVAITRRTIADWIQVQDPQQIDFKGPP